VAGELFTKSSKSNSALGSFAVEWKVEKIISGGQTGVDRAALDAALELGISCGGWCPRGRKAEDGIVPLKYPLEETSSPDYPQRTEMNIQDSDGTLLLTWGPPVGGTLLTLRLARKHHKPYLLIDLNKGEEALKVLEWLKNSLIQTLNVAGPRESEAPGIHDRAWNLLRTVFPAQGRK
jgi:predicted Rossmann-fold nucleotide-binding protein